MVNSEYQIYSEKRDNMSEFAELLGEIIKDGNLTVYGLAKVCDV